VWICLPERETINAGGMTKGLMMKGARIEIVDFWALFLLIPSPASGFRKKRCSLFYKLMSHCFRNWIWIGRGLGFEIFHTPDKKKKTQKQCYAVKPRFFILRVPFLVGTLLLANLRQLLHKDFLTSPSTLEHTLSMLLLYRNEARNTCRNGLQTVSP